MKKQYRITNTTYDVDTLQFIEPEEPEVDEDASADADMPESDEPMDIADAMNIVGADVDATVADVAPADDSAKEEIPVMVIDPEQLNLF